MSDFLFRMVERAAGLSAATAPQPPRPFQWPSSAETPYPGKSTFDSFAESQPVRPTSVRPSLPLKPLTTGRIEQGGQEPDIQTAPGASSLQQQAATYETARTFIQAQDGKEMRREPHHSVEADVNKQAVKHSNDRLRQDAEQTSHEVSGKSSVTNTLHVHVKASRSTARPLATRSVEVPRSTSQPVARLLDNLPTVETDTSLVTAPVDRTSTRTPRSAAETPVPQENRPQAAAMQASKEVSEPPVEVKIGRVEIRFDAPATPAASSAPARPSGFSEYAALRSYAIRPWGSRNR